MNTPQEWISIWNWNPLVATEIERIQKDAQEELSKRIADLESALKVAKSELLKTEHGELHGYDQRYHCFSCGAVKPSHHDKCTYLEALAAIRKVEGLK